MATNRRDFIKGALVSSAAVVGMGASGANAAKSVKNVAEESIISHDAPARNRRPYTGIDWEKSEQIITTSHGHCDDQEMLDMYVKRGFGFMTISNYYPSAPRYPGKTYTKLYYHFHSDDYPLMVRGERKTMKFSWNELIDPWKDEIAPEVRSQYPFDPKNDVLLFPNWPEGMLEAPNAEHHQFLLDDGKPATSVHMTAPGSFYKSGSIDKWNLFRTHSKAGISTGTGEKWRTAVDRMIKELMFADGGGVVVAHPMWSNLNRELFLKMLDHDPRVLGCEAMNSGDNDERFWDWALATGRQCFGFFVPDHRVSSKNCGVNVLVVPEHTVHACLQAYRQGNFYGARQGSGVLRFTNIAFDGKTVSASTDKPAKLEVITAQGVIKKEESDSISWEVPVGKYEKNGPGVHVFARIKAIATDGSGEMLWSQAFML